MPCTHCHALLLHVSKYRLRKYGQQVGVRYSDSDGQISDAVSARDLPDGKMSRWYREVYRRKHQRNERVDVGRRSRRSQRVATRKNSFSGVII
jgi:hypothetical protein